MGENWGKRKEINKGEVRHVNGTWMMQYANCDIEVGLRCYKYGSIVRRAREQVGSHVRQPLAVGLSSNTRVRWGPFFCCGIRRPSLFLCLPLLHSIPLSRRHSLLTAVSIVTCLPPSVITTLPSIT